MSFEVLICKNIHDCKMGIEKASPKKVCHVDLAFKEALPFPTKNCKMKGLVIEGKSGKPTVCFWHNLNRG